MTCTSLKRVNSSLFSFFFNCSKHVWWLSGQEIRNCKLIFRRGCTSSFHRSFERNSYGLKMRSCRWLPIHLESFDTMIWQTDTVLDCLVCFLPPSRASLLCSYWLLFGGLVRYLQANMLIRSTLVAAGLVLLRLRQHNHVHLHLHPCITAHGLEMPICSLHYLIGFPA